MLCFGYWHVDRSIDFLYRALVDIDAMVPRGPCLVLDLLGQLDLLGTSDFGEANGARISQLRSQIVAYEGLVRSGAVWWMSGAGAVRASRSDQWRHTTAETGA